METIITKKENTILLTMTDGYGILTKYCVKNECPWCKTPLHITGGYFGCHDGEWGTADNFECENGHKPQYREMREYNSID